MIRTDFNPRLTQGIFFVCCACCTSTPAQTIWTGPDFSFTRPGAGLATDPANQDMLTPNVILTRAATQGIFNIAVESGYDFGVNTAPADTEWAFGTTDDLESLTFLTWFGWHGRDPPGTVGQDAVLHLISDDIFLDIRFTDWGGNGSGGMFSYVRSTPASGSLLGDFNEDEVVDAADYTVWRDSLGAAGGLPNNGDLADTVDGTYYDLWKTNFGSTLAGGSLIASAPVPEPAAGMLQTAGVIGLLALRSREKQVAEHDA